MHAEGFAASRRSMMRIMAMRTKAAAILALATNDFLARVIAGRVELRAPFCAPCAVRLSMVPVVRLASLPVCSQTAT
jgi:hypothetical protein